MDDDAVSTVKLIYDTVEDLKEAAEHVEGNDAACALLAQRCTSLLPYLQALEAQMGSDNALGEQLSQVLRLLQEIGRFITRFQDRQYVVKMWKRDSDTEAFNNFHIRLSQAIQDLHIGPQYIPGPVPVPQPAYGSYPGVQAPYQNVPRPVSGTQPAYGPYPGVQGQPQYVPGPVPVPQSAYGSHLGVQGQPQYVPGPVPVPQSAYGSYPGVQAPYQNVPGHVPGTQPAYGSYPGVQVPYQKIPAPVPRPQPAGNSGCIPS